MIDLELELGIAWKDKAKTDYELYAAIVERYSHTILSHNWLGNYQQETPKPV